MYIPIVGDRVRLQGQSVQFLVLCADYARQVADLVDVNQSIPPLRSVPFQSIFAVFEDAEAERIPPESSSASHAQSRMRVRSGH